MAIVKMKRLRLAAVKSQREDLLREMMVLGFVEISDPISPAADSELEGLLAKEPAGFFERKSDYDRLLWSLGLLDKYAPQKSSLFTSRPLIGSDAILDDSGLDEGLRLAKQIDVADDHIRSIVAEESHLKSLIESLEPWKPMDVPFDLRETKTCFTLPGNVPINVSVKDIEAQLAAEDVEGAVFEISVDANMRYLLVISMLDKRPAAMELLRKFNFTSSSLTELQGTAVENIRRIEARLKELESKKQELSDEIAALAPNRDELKLCADRMLTKATQAENSEKLLYTHSSFTFDGWFPADQEKALEKLLSAYDCAWETEEPTEEDMPEVPIKLKSNTLTRPMTMVTEMYSLPAYNGVDPNPQMLPTFALFFGIMFADLGYGLILLIAGLVITLKIKPRGTMGYMGGIGIITGISCMVFGAITGTFFGDIIPQVCTFFGFEPYSLPFLIDPLKAPMTILYICLGMGVLHLLQGIIVNAYMLIRDGHAFDALCDAGPVFLVLGGVVLGAIGITWYVAIAGIVAVILTQGRSSPSIIGKLGGGLWGLYNFVTGWFGDVLSYCRIMALMLAGTVIAQVFNTLGVMTGNIIAFIVIFLVGHALNFGLNLIGTFVHTSRLEYLEFFGKFYRDGGRAFDPLEMKTNYYNVSKN